MATPDLPERPQDQRRRKEYGTSRVRKWEKALAHALEQKLTGDDNDLEEQAWQKGFSLVLDAASEGYDLREVAVLRDPSQRVLGTVRKRSDDTLEIRNSSNKFRGSYDPSVDETRDSTGRLIGTGNLLAALLVNEGRDYRKEYHDYHGTPKQRKNRSTRNQARRKMELETGDEREVDHSKPLSQGGTNHGNNLKVVSFAKNRTKGAKHEGVDPIDPIMEPGFVKTPADEKKWDRAKTLAKKSNPDNMYAVANHIFHSLKGKKTVSETWCQRFGRALDTKIGV